MKKKIIFSAVTLAILGSAIGSSIVMKQGQATDVPPIIQQVQHNTEQLDNHEARITNAENNIKDLQNKTSTPESPANTPLPVVTTPPPTQSITPVTQPTPITIVAFEQIPNGDSEIDCKLTYSDGTTSTWVWQTWEYNQGTRITHGAGSCDNSLIGQLKN